MLQSTCVKHQSPQYDEPRPRKGRRYDRPETAGGGLTYLTVGKTRQPIGHPFFFLTSNCTFFVFVQDLVNVDDLKKLYKLIFV